jgi:hypothetical protein
MIDGIHCGLSFEEYRKINAVNNSSLGSLSRSPRHYKLAQDSEPGKSLQIGSLVHCGALEPQALAERYAVVPAFHLDPDNVTAQGKATTSQNTTYCKQRTRDFLHENKGKDAVPAEWYAEAMAMIEALAADQVASELLSTERTELTLVWHDEPTGLRCKARLDAVTDIAIVDLKTTRELESFHLSFYSYKYHRQMAHYQSGWAHLTGEILPAWVVAIESAPPYCVQAAPVSDDAIALGLHQRDRLLQLLQVCIETDHWPGPESPTAWDVPSWAIQAEPMSITINGEEVSI